MCYSQIRPKKKFKSKCPCLVYSSVMDTNGRSNDNVRSLFIVYLDSMLCVTYKPDKIQEPR